MSEFKFGIMEGALSKIITEASQKSIYPKSQWQIKTVGNTNNHR